MKNNTGTELNAFTSRRDEIPTDEKSFKSSQLAGFNGLLDRSIFTMVPSTEAKGLRVDGSCLVNDIKHEKKPEAFRKSRFVFQAYNDKDHGFLTHASTVQRVFQRLLLASCAIDNRCAFFIRDVPQAYIQA